MQPTVHWRVQVYFPVFLEGANLSMGDMHFSQGDGEVSLCSRLGVRLMCCTVQEACAVSQCMPLLLSETPTGLAAKCEAARRASSLARPCLPLPVTPPPACLLLRAPASVAQHRSLPGC